MGGVVWSLASDEHMKTSAIEPAEPRPPCDAGLVEFFLLFSGIGLSSFGGGVSVWMHRAVVERRGWLSESEFFAALALARIMPGVNIVNLAVLIGHRLIGFTGAVAAVMEILVAPSVVVVGLAVLCRKFAGSIALDTALAGAAASAVGLLIGMGLKSGSRIVRMGVASKGGTLEGVGAIVLMLVVFVCIGVLRLPTVPTVLCLTACSVALVLMAPRHAPIERHRNGG
jgi:chromate transporter